MIRVVKIKVVVKCGRCIWDLILLVKKGLYFKGDWDLVFCLGIGKCSIDSFNRFYVGCENIVCLV